MAFLDHETWFSATVVGVLFTALSTSLPELATSLAAVRRGALALAWWNRDRFASDMLLDPAISEAPRQSPASQAGFQVNVNNFDYREPTTLHVA
ncbi:MAG: sodium/calcium exchanger protein [Wenzhouxiangellaceae bacterium]|nr:sodium/calcium exchanger protein [Wenzhouxiangellaceae bacterium]